MMKGVIQTLPSTRFVCARTSFSPNFWWTLFLLFEWIHPSMWEGVCAAEQRTKNTKQPFFDRAFSALTDMRSEKDSHLAYCSWLTSNNDAFSRILDGTHEIWCAHIKNTRIHRQYRCFWFLLALYVELHFLTLWSTFRTWSWSKHESLCTSLRNHVMSTHSDPTPGCPDHFTTPHSHFHLFLPPLNFVRNEPVRAQIWKKFEIWLRSGHP